MLGIGRGPIWRKLQWILLANFTAASPEPATNRAILGTMGIGSDCSRGRLESSLNIAAVPIGWVLAWQGIIRVFKLEVK
ncbi:hypothetical protein VNO77_27048 [Canavalia gladiata]|uniref:Uncharacterized protein n=1 Tax=Canavalia gladiata TaxID=3824 RepID=A0AAN9Q645_CANGL